jgi:hypothetical protein
MKGTFKIELEIACKIRLNCSIYNSHTTFSYPYIQLDAGIDDNQYVRQKIKVLGIKKYQNLSKESCFALVRLLATVNLDLRWGTLSTDRFRVQVVEFSTRARVEYRIPAPGKVGHPAAVVRSEFQLARATSLNREIELQLGVVSDVPNAVQLISQKTLFVEMEDDTDLIAVRNVEELSRGILVLVISFKFSRMFVFLVALA